MFQLVKGRHRFGSGGERAEVALQERITRLQAELATYKALAERRAHLINVFKVGIAVLILAFGFALGVNIAAVKQAVVERVQALGFAGGVKDTDAAYAAYQKGDYSTALRHLRPLADQGDARAQFVLGVMYAEGQGVPQDYAEAVKWYRRAANHSHAQAQYNLGLSYAKGEGVPQDDVSAHMWFNLAAARFPVSDTRNHDLAVRNRELVANKMTREQIAEAQNLAREWKPR
jgi:tetratricopeptide (TPR) repeat protein